MPPKCHDEVIEAIQSAIGPRDGELRLLGRVQDPLLGHGAADDVFFFVPDLHLLTPERQTAFGKLEFNYGDPCLLAEILKALAVLKKKWDDAGTAKLRTFQIGDFFDIWREFPKQVDTSKIGDSVYSPLRDILYRGIYRGLACLKTTFLLGNHDIRNADRLTELNCWTKAFNYTGRPAEKPFLLALHGDAFDFIEKFPTWLKALAVNLAGNSTQVNAYPVGVDMTRINKPLKELTGAITEPEHDLSVQGALKVTPGGRLPRFLCDIAKDLSADPLPHRFMGKIHDVLEEAREESLTGSDVRIVALGHTHKAKMVLYAPDTNEPPFLVMDVGAWIENCKYIQAENGNTITEPSAQLGVIHANDARLYQISIPAA
jgi:UDP-2,3-diacylglucosamine pyrophosphatase LpxH